ncbi:MAG: hypothetical protein GY787_29910 [Alteromonadales bacterium]|nr:hypothetical protein [Alteromonadales bacterium]
MLKITDTALITKEGVGYFQEEKFTGAVFFIKGDLVDKITSYKDGLPTGPYKSEWLATTGLEPCVLLDALIGDGGETPYANAYFEGCYFTGLVYDFENEVCIRESQFIKGNEWDNVDFYMDGSPEYYSVMKENVDETVQFRYGGEIKISKIRIDQLADRCKAEFEYDPEQRLDTVSYRGDFFNEVAKVKHLLVFNTLDSFEKLQKTYAAPRIFLCDPGVDDTFFEALKSNDGLRDTVDIDIFDTALSIEVIISLFENIKLKEVSISDERAELLPLLQAVKLKRPDCRISFNDKIL